MTSRPNHTLVSAVLLIKGDCPLLATFGEIVGFKTWLSPSPAPMALPPLRCHRLPENWSVFSVLRGPVFFQRLETRTLTKLLYQTELGSHGLWGPSADPPAIFYFHPPFSGCNECRSLPMSPPRRSSGDRPGAYLTRDPCLGTALALPLT